MTASSHGEMGTLVVDARFGTRRFPVEPDPDRNRVFRLILLVVVAALALSAVIVLESPILDVDDILVSGAHAVDSAQVAEAAGVDIGAPLLLADLEGARRRVEALPWVAEAVVDRDLPSGITIDVVERIPAAIVASGSTMVLVDPDGHVLGDGAPAAYPAAVEAFPPFVQVMAPDAPPAPGGRVDRTLLDAVALAERLRSNPANTVVAVHLEPTLNLELAGGGSVDFGDFDEVDAKVEAFRTIHVRVDQRCISVLDLRVPTRPVLTRDEPCS